MGEIPDPGKRDVDEVLRSVERADNPFFAEFERDMQKFLAENKDNPAFEGLFEGEGKKRKDWVQDGIRVWEEENQDYALKYIDPDKVGVTNRSDKEVCIEFVDYLIGNLKAAVKDEKILGILEDPEEISVVRVTQNNEGVYVVVTSKDRGKFGALFQGGPEFKLKLVEIKEKIYTF